MSRRLRREFKSRRLRQEFTEYIMVGIGGMIGAVGRYSISVVISDAHSFPYATLLTNWVGCFLLSYILSYHPLQKKISPAVFAGLSIGAIGSFTSFSRVAVDAVFKISHLSIAISYIFLTLFGCLLLSYAGFKVATRKQGDL